MKTARKYAGPVDQLCPRPEWQSEYRSCCTDVDVTRGGLIPCAGHGKFRSETVPSGFEEHHGLNLSLIDLLVRI